MTRSVVASLAVLFVSATCPAFAQSGAGSLNGFIKDQQGSVLPGVTVTAMGPELQAPIVGVTDSAGYYRLVNGYGKCMNVQKAWMSEH